MRRIDVIALGPQHVGESYALARLAFPRLSLTQWRSLAGRWLKSSRGLNGALVARDSGSRMVGLAPYQVRESLMNGRILVVERLVCLGLFDAAPVQMALIRNLIALGQDLDCHSLDIGSNEDLDETATAAFGRKNRSELLHFPLDAQQL